VLFVGYQASGTLGHLIRNGAQRVRIHVPQLDERFVLHRSSGDLSAEKLSPERRRADDELRAALASGRDWHNEYAQTVLEVRSALLAAPDDATRRRMLDRVKAALGGR